MIGKDDFEKLEKMERDDLIADTTNIPTKSDPVSVSDDTNTGSETLGKISFSEWKEVIQRNFPSLLLPAEVGLSLFGQLMIEDIVNPCAVVLIDVPSSGKTIALNMFSDIPQSYSTDNFTPSAFVSQAANVKKEKLADVDMLPKIKDKVLIVRDLAPIFGQRDDDLLRNMGVLTRVMDGEGLQFDAGVHGQRGYIGDYNFMLLAASTPIPPKIFKLMGNLGSRLFFLSMNSVRKGEDELIQQIQSESWKVKQKECKEVSTKLIATLFSKHSHKLKWDKAKDPEKILRIISRSASLLSSLRGSINLWKDNGLDGVEYSYQAPVIEMPDRINQILYNFARGHAIACEREKLNNQDLKVILNICFDSAPLSRSKLFKLLIASEGVLTTTQITQSLGCSDTTADKEMEILKILGVVSITAESDGNVGRPEKQITLAKDLEWFKSDECLDLIGAKRVVHDSDDSIEVAKQLFGA